MTTLQTACKWLLVVGIVVLTGPTAPGQEKSAIDADLQRSWQIQARLAQIEANRASFVHEFLMAWTPYVDNQVNDLFDELGPLAMRAPAWQLYGASLVGDFKTVRLP